MNERQAANQLLRFFHSLSSDPLPLRIKHLYGSAKSLLSFAVLQRSPAVPAVIVVPDTERALWEQDLTALAEIYQRPFLVFAPEASSLGYALEDADPVSLGLMPALSALLQRTDPAPIILTPVQSLQYPLPPPAALESQLLRVRVGDTLAFEEFIGILALQGYNRKEFVEFPGEFAVRGGIVDVFPPDAPFPLRFEFFGDEIDSIRQFDPRSQRSIKPLQEFVFLSALHFDDETSHSLASYLPPETLLVVDSPPLLFSESTEESRHGLEQLLDRFSNQITLNAPDGSAVLHCAAPPAIRSSLQTLWKHLEQFSQQQYTIVFTAETPAALRRLRDLLEEYAETEADGAFLSERFPSLQWLPMPLAAGFVAEELRLAVFTEQEIFHRIKTQRRQQRGGITLHDLETMKKGDYVVHVDKGVAIFDGLTTIEMGGQSQDCVRLIFADNDVVYLNVNYLHKLQKFSAQDGAPPKLTRLGTREWERKKSKAKKKLRDIAHELIELYARRKAAEGFAFPPDTIWQKEMEAAFPFEDTPDQAKATREVKADMEQPHPMDRLVCGDVGFGKTEIAIRAAFKAVEAGKQVAVLVPTTILALQHYETFQDRLGAYPVEIALLSRMRSPAEQREIVRRLKDGTIDIVIGTHRLLSKDIQFRDLGLLIIDEEHRFGVAAKEKLRKLKVSVDTLTLTATPIPRTLHMALIGAKDISIIATPPRNRLPIVTQVIQWDPFLIREAIDRELARGGQIFFVNNRIGNLPDLAEELRAIAPDLRIAIVHGKMPPRDIERIMHRFIEKKIDLLLATKIIEAGIDIPNANTMFINQADKFGLAELYQLRGRVGRSSVQAYCYLITPPFHQITRQAARRLQALEEFTNLGSGLNLALRDLEIRGAGNIFGAEQSGYIEEIGFEMYQKMLEEAIQDIKYRQMVGDRTVEAQEIFDLLRNRNDLTIESFHDLRFPPSYMPLESERFRYYKLLYRATSEEQLQQLRSEIEDQYGTLPPSAALLFDHLRIRIAALPLGFTTLRLEPERAIAELPGDPDHPFALFLLDPLLQVLPHFPTLRLRQRGNTTELLIPYTTIDELFTTLQQLQSSIAQQFPASAPPLSSEEPEAALRA